MTALRLVSGTAADFAAKCHATKPKKSGAWKRPSGTRARTASAASFRHGASAQRVLVTSRARAWPAPSGRQANGNPNTDYRVAMRAGTLPLMTTTGENVGQSRPNMGQGAAWWDAECEHCNGTNRAHMVDCPNA